MVSAVPFQRTEAPLTKLLARDGEAECPPPSVCAGRVQSGDVGRLNVGAAICESLGGRRDIIHGLLLTVMLAVLAVRGRRRGRLPSGLWSRETSWPASRRSRGPSDPLK